MNNLINVNDYEETIYEAKYTIDNYKKLHDIIIPSRLNDINPHIQKRQFLVFDSVYFNAVCQFSVPY